MLSSDQIILPEPTEIDILIQQEVEAYRDRWLVDPIIINFDPHLSIIEE
jgi:hypothetical protein